MCWPGPRYRDEPDHQPWCGHRLRRRLHACPLGRFAAVVDDYGHHGQVIDLQTGTVTLTLDGGDYHPDTVPFSLAFTDCEGRAVVIHRTAWNRLDISDASTGELLTRRELASHRQDEPPGHYLDYSRRAAPFSGGRWIADDGWVWAPVGVPCVWDLRRWLSGDLWEADDGPSRRSLCPRAYHWDVPMCWTGENLLAISGIGSDDEAMLDGVRIFDVTTGSEVAAFAARPVRCSALDVACSPRPVAVLRCGAQPPASGPGTSLGFAAVAHHQYAGELVAVGDGLLHRWTAPR